MIVLLYQQDQQTPQKYPFTQACVIIGRNPSGESSVAVEEQSVSRNHLKVRVSNEKSIQIMDLNSSNGTFVRNERIASDSWFPVKQEEEIKIADFKGFITIKLRENHLPNKKNIEAPKKSKKIDDSDQESSSEERQRSRDKKVPLPFKISDSALKMVKQMTVAKRPKQQRIKFLKLMGIGKAEQYWPQIQQLLKQRRGIRNNQQTSDDLERQFQQGRSGFEKKGLGR